MPCQDSSSSMWIKLDADEHLLSYEFAKITCGSEIKGNQKFQAYVKGKSLTDILYMKFVDTLTALNIQDEESQFVLHLELDALRSAISNYLGEDHPEVDSNRSRITTIAHQDDGIEISLVLLPPKEMPKIIPCHLKKT